MQRQAALVAGLFAQGLGHAHPHRALHLTLDRERVDGAPAIMRDPDLLDANHAGVKVDLDLDDLRGIAECHGRADGAAAMPAALVLHGYGESPLHRDAAAVGERGRGDLAEAEAGSLAAA